LNHFFFQKVIQPVKNSYTFFKTAPVLADVTIWA
jgi:hypothetical protein